LIVGRNETGIPVDLPDLYGMSIPEAKARVSEMLNIELFIVCPDCMSKSDSTIARVRSQSPEFTEGAVIPSGSSVTIYATKEFDSNRE
jgi:beta-lactam-binding protein with PASTA domain